MKIPLTLERRGGLELYLPIVPVDVEGIEEGFDALIDTGSDITIFPAGILPEGAKDSTTGIGDKEAPIVPANKTMIIRQDGQQYVWETIIWFSEKERTVLGYKGFMEYFSITINDVSKEVIIEPNNNFPGKATKLF